MPKRKINLTEAEARLMYETALKYSKTHGHIARGADSFHFLNCEEWLDYCNDSGDDKCPEEWVGDTGTTSPAILVVPVGTFVDDENDEAVTWGVFRNAGVKDAANFLASIASFKIPPERRETVAGLMIQAVRDNRQHS